MMADLLARYGGGDLELEYDPLEDPNYGEKTKLKRKKKVKKGKKGKKGKAKTMPKPVKRSKRARKYNLTDV